MAGHGPGSLTIQVLDTVQGIPAEGMRIELWRLDPDPAQVAEARTEAGGSPPAPLLAPEGFRAGLYELRLHVGAYFAARGLGPEPPFLEAVILRLGLADGQGPYHLPLLCSPWSCTACRGSQGGAPAQARVSEDPSRDWR
jgi:5-hydroxyisourate hydrolase